MVEMNYMVLNGIGCAEMMFLMVTAFMGTTMARAFSTALTELVE